MYDRVAYQNSESPLRKVLYKLFKKRASLTIFDIGGCEGEDAIKYARLFLLSTIYVFEPLKGNQTLIIQNIQNYQLQNIELVPIALSSKNGPHDYFVSSGRPQDQEANIDWDFGNKSSSLLSRVK